MDFSELDTNCVSPHSLNPDHATEAEGNDLVTTSHVTVEMIVTKSEEQVLTERKTQVGQGLPSSDTMDLNGDSLGFLDKIKVMHKQKQRQSTGKPQTTEGRDTFYFCFFFSTYFSIIYIGIFYSIPNAFENPYIQYCFTAASLVIAFNSLYNLALVRFTNNGYTFNHSDHILRKYHWTNGNIDSSAAMFPTKILPSGDEWTRDKRHKILTWSVEWDYCQACQQPKPPRSHHCYTCNQCILKRDHHCFIAGKCIGFYNQRFFVMMSFYTAAACLTGGVVNTIYIKDHFYETSLWSDYFLPITLWRLLTGQTTLMFFFMVFDFYAFAYAGPMSAMFFAQQIAVICQGQTSHENLKFIQVPRNTWRENYRSVFGDYWLLNFLFPAHHLFRQPGDGTQWVSDQWLESVRKDA